jgi:hypothetical protein
MQSLELQNLNTDEIGTQGMPVDEPEEPYGDDDDDDEKKNKTKPVGLLGYNKCSSFREDYHEKFKEAMYPPGCSEGVWENFCYIVRGLTSWILPLALDSRHAALM